MTELNKFNDKERRAKRRQLHQDKDIRDSIKTKQPKRKREDYEEDE